MSADAVCLRAVDKAYHPTRVLSGLDLDVPEATITAVLGASGSGKTTLLKVIAGFERLDSGTITVSGKLVDDGRNAIGARHRGLGYVPQEGSLFPHLTVRGNIGFGLRRRDRAVIGELLELIGMTDLDRRYPHELSGGQQQRVALARALAVGPSLVLLDEPFAALDASLRTDLRREVVRILRERGTAAILVTHDRDEALALADEVALLAGGAIAVRARPSALYRDPPSPEAAAAVGNVNLIDAVIDGGRGQCVLGAIPIQPGGPEGNGGPVRLMIRPEQLQVATAAGEGATPAVVLGIEYHGHDLLAQLEVHGAGNGPLLARLSGERELARGQRVWIAVAGAARAWPCARS